MDDRELAVLERRGRVLGLVITEALLAVFIVVCSAVALSWREWGQTFFGSAPLLGIGRPPAETYAVLASMVGLAGIVLLHRHLGWSRRLLAAGGVVLLVAVVVGVLPIQSDGNLGRTSCTSVLGEFGSHGDDHENCFDIRRSVGFDVAALGAVGFTLVGAGVALAGARPSS